ncbi:D-2-hydroxyacid dehydrogenase [Poriferisphaera sp. WC338]|uniref:D-2-hydroxyacid dehydrogenase n=1 Tax=Poriferisphaera sp. WC338 TaxID=3425129 RepID=UPI003D818C29
MPSTINIGVADPTATNIAKQLCDQLIIDHVHVIDCSTPEAQRQHASSLDGLVTELWFPQPEEAPHLRWIHLLSSGYDHVPISALSCEGWTITHGGGTGAVPMAEWCLSMMLYFTHRVDDILAYQANRSWYQHRIQDMTASTLRGATLGIMGYGAVGRELARQCKPLGMTIYASCGRSGHAQPLTYTAPETGDTQGELPDHWFDLNDLYSILPKCDVVVLGLRSSPKTHQLVNVRFLEQMKRSAILINPARGSLIDEAALIQALENQQLRGAALDVFANEPLPANDPLRDAPHLIISPHCSPESSFYRQQMIECIIKNIQRFIEDQPLFNRIASPPKTSTITSC